MSTAIAMAPSPAPHDRDRSSYVDIVAPAPSSKSPPAQRTSASATPNVSAQRTGSTSPKSTPASKGSPTASRNGVPPKIIVKKEPPSSPDLPTSRHRPRKLDLSKNTSSVNPGTARPSAGPLTSRGESGGLAIQDVGLACLSPGFVTQDPTMREQLQRSISVREQQRHIIESRLQQTAKPGDAPTESAKERDFGGFAKTPGTSKRKAPPGLSIVAPSHEQFAHERVIQSAPLNQSFTGRHQPHPLTRHIANQPSNLSNTSHIHHVPAAQTTNRLPPITDVFAENGLGHHRETSGRASNVQNNSSSTTNSSHSNTRPNFPSPGHSQPQPPHSARPREYRSAEDAQVELAGGRPELLPKLVHYGGHQPPTPPSPLTGNAMRHAETSRSGGARRRTRAEYEEGASPPLGNGPATSRRGPFGEGRDSPITQQKKKDEFIQLCARAWDLFHS
ncbi:Uncharacterized protein BP5553_06987 [Venustampulla echinocandica]|uniref:Uncharacterized protein n=1 Tax=Venustampulla echinocandica TaxID=2656787 RepID=A0A370TI76_9HELO|nr:Uncharacterized protein BP5553_06987 [Venustampulla echinocandica]RDL35056.1 Uncharacterized protein BP5553_06987 [Venustampulla echinocandica]